MTHKTAKWSLQEAKAKFSEVVRRARSEGPQWVTVHGKDAVVITSAELQPAAAKRDTGASLITLMQASPLRDLADEVFERARMPAQQRDIDL